MDKISSIEIRKKFLSFFREKDHLEIENSSVIPKNDPTLLFINSGMAPIKNYFTGVQKPPYARLCNVQPCIRTIDIDSIGDKHHLTSFQMLGSWSINDYFKEKAISLAFEFLTKHLNIPKEKLYVTVFSGDESLNLPFDSDAYDYWKKVGMPESHIVKCGKEDNFWGPTAETGPCGPCTEIFYDTGEGEEYFIGGKFDTSKRYIEIWNAGVFMQLNKNADGTFSRLGFTSVDTGAGLERLSMVLNGHSTVYDTDLLKPIRNFIESKISYDLKMSERDVLIMTDHLRTATLILSEKISPSNEGRGYIPRKLIRRCMMIVAKNKVQNFDFAEVIEFIIENYSEIFENFKVNKEYIISEIKKEQAQFSKVLNNGIERLENIKAQGCHITSDDAFDLVTTYGLPFDIIKTYSIENNMSLNETEFENRLKVHKEKSRNVSAGSNVNNVSQMSEFLETCEKTNFVGYENLKIEAKVIKLIRNGKLVNSATVGDNITIVLDNTSFYAESGGQCADTGYMYNDQCKINILDVKKNTEGVFVHFGVVESGTISDNDIIVTTVDEEKRKNTKNNHTSVHLLQSALQTLFGKNVHQSGSKVDHKRLRFDFNYEKSINDIEICEIEKLVNGYIRENIERKIEIKNVSDAIKSGAIALFESKYGDNVRVVSYGKISSELCGGTHTEMTGNIGLFKIISVDNIGKGIKRITAVTGEEALKILQQNTIVVNKLSKILKVKPESILEKIEKEFSQKNKEKPAVKNIDASELNYIDGYDFKFAYIVSDDFNKKIIPQIVKISNQIQGIVVGIFGFDKCNIIVSVSDKYVERFEANEILSRIMNMVGGKGGGNKSVASGSAVVDRNRIIEVIKAFKL